MKKGYTLPRAAMANADLARIINSTEVQSLGTALLRYNRCFCLLRCWVGDGALVTLKPVSLGFWCFYCSDVVHASCIQGVLVGGV